MNERIYKFRVWNKEEKVMFLIGSNPNLTNYQQTIYELMQFTGLKDENGKEIYEGDIFDCIYKFDGCEIHKLVVVWNEASARFKLKGYGICHQPNVEKTMGDLEMLKIIGNIYENPELLN